MTPMVAVYFYALQGMPECVQRHVCLCHKSPADCLLCLMVRLQIDRRQAG